MATAVDATYLPTDQECFDYIPPEAFPGMSITFYPHGRPVAGKRPEVGQVVRVPETNKYLSVWLPHKQQAFNSVRHINDPRLVRNPNLLEDGAWDYTDHDKKLRDRLADLESRLAELSGDRKADVEDEDHGRLAALESKFHSLSIKLGKLASEVGATSVKE